MTFNKTKFQNLLLYFAKKSEADVFFGSIKLNKLFYYSDFWAYAALGDSITGATYIHKPRGPVPSEMGPMLLEMEKDGKIHKTLVPNWLNGGEQIRVVADSDPKLAKIFLDEEIKICEAQLEFLRGKTADQISDQAHNWMGWLYTDGNEQIPYYTIYSRNLLPVTIADLKWASEKLSFLGR